MKKSIQIQIPQPCHENWDKMSAANQGRFCNACSKVVVDFSMMSDNEILNHISKASSKICGRVNYDQLNRPIQVPVERKRISFRYLWGLLISSILVSYKTQAQGKIKMDSIVTSAPSNLFQTALSGRVGGVVVLNEKKSRDKISFINGKVTDENGEAIPFVTIRISDSKYGAVTDSGGKFQLKVKSSIVNSKLVASSIGYEEVLIDLMGGDQGDLEVVMSKSNIEMMGEVVISSRHGRRCTSKLGGISYGITISENRFTTVLNELIGSNEIKVFPNPVTPGNTFNISFNVVETGKYRLELYDNAGKLMQTSAISIPSKKFTMNFAGSLPLTSGIYFVKILSVKGKNIYSGSLLVQ